MGKEIYVMSISKNFEAIMMRLKEISQTYPDNHALSVVRDLNEIIKKNIESFRSLPGTMYHDITEAYQKLRKLNINQQDENDIHYFNTIIRDINLAAGITLSELKKENL